MTIPTIEDYKLENGRYDTTRIRTDAGLSERAARFDDIFADAGDGMEKSVLTDQWQSLVEEADHRNRALSQEIVGTEETVGTLTVALRTEDSEDRKEALRERRAHLVAAMDIQELRKHAAAAHATGDRQLAWMYGDYESVRRQNFEVNSELPLRVGEVFWRGAALLRVEQVLGKTTVGQDDGEVVGEVAATSYRVTLVRK